MKRTKKPTKIKMPWGGNEQGERRYEKGRFPVYDFSYENAMNSSPILNAKHRGNSFSHMGVLENLESSLAELEGNPDKDYHYLNNGNWQKALIPVHELELRNLYIKFNNWKKEQVTRGYSLTPPKKWPSSLIEDRLKREAFLDVRRREAYTIKKMIAEKQSEQEKERESKILKNGVMGIGLHGTPSAGRSWLVDGQQVNTNENGVPYIDEPSSKYHLMPLVYYRQLVPIWKEYMERTAQEIYDQKVKESKENPRKGKPTEFMLIGLKKRRPITADELKNLPDWPEGAKKITELHS